jgi:hypothetical protein
VDPDLRKRGSTIRNAGEDIENELWRVGFNEPTLVPKSFGESLRRRRNYIIPATSG